VDVPHSSFGSSYLLLCLALKRLQQRSLSYEHFCLFSSLGLHPLDFVVLMSRLQDSRKYPREFKLREIARQNQ